MNEGTVTFTVTNGSTIYSMGSGTVSGGVVMANFPLVTPTLFHAGGYSIQATYNPGSNFLTSSAPAGTLNVGKASTMTAITGASPNPATLGQSVSFSVSVTPVAPSTVTPSSGTAQFFDSTNTLGSAVSLGAGGSAQLITSALPVGARNITAVYSGNNDFNQSPASAIFVENVQYGVCPLITQNPPFAVKSGATFPIKLYLCDAGMNDVSSSGVIVHATQILLGSAVTGTPEDAGNSNPDSDFRFDSTLGPSGGYIFNLQTKGLSGGTWVMKFVAGYNPSNNTWTDPVIHSVQFGVK